MKGTATLPLLSLLFLLGYGVALHGNLPLFVYFPVTGEIALSLPQHATGPAMRWYGLLGSAVTVACFAPLIAAVRAPVRLDTCLRVAPPILMIMVVIHEAHWFLR